MNVTYVCSNNFSNNIYTSSIALLQSAQLKDINADQQ